MTINWNVYEPILQRIELESTGANIHDRRGIMGRIVNYLALYRDAVNRKDYEKAEERMNILCYNADQLNIRDDVLMCIGE